jgi:hypothetical protein
MTAVTSRQRRSSRGTRSLLAAVAISLPILALTVPVAAHDGHDRALDRRVAAGLKPGAIVRDHGITMAVPRPGGFAWGELKFADGTYQELGIETARDGTVFVSGRGNERAALLSDRFEAAARGIGTGGLAPDGGRSFKATKGGGECGDTYRNLYWWRTPDLDWRFNPAGTPSYLRDAEGKITGVKTAIANAQRNITTAFNKCGRTDRISAKGDFLGVTRRNPNISSGASCTGGDGRSVIGWGDLPSYSIAMTCVYGVRNGVASEADIRMNNVDTRWAVDMATCDGRELLIEAAMTHEFGHAYGLAHASIYRNPALTMQPLVRNCSWAHASLGLGDLLGLEKKY